MRRCFAWLVVACALVLQATVLPRSASASTFVELSLADLLKMSNLVVVATSGEQTCVWEQTDGGRSRRIVTYTHMTVDRVLDGAAAAPKDVWVRTLGGQVGDIGQQVEGEAVLVPLQTSLLFLRARGDGTHAVAAMGQGQFAVKASGAGEPPRLFPQVASGRLLAPAALARSARDALSDKTLDEVAKVIEAERRRRAH
jgi:hypothetical protein